LQRLFLPDETLAYERGHHLAVLVSSRALLKQNDFTFSPVMFCEKLRIGFRIDSYRGVRVERLDRLDSLPFIGNGNKQPFLQRSTALARQDGNDLPSLRHVLNMAWIGPAANRQFGGNTSDF
jgi:hypothetical protein